MPLGIKLEGDWRKAVEVTDRMAKQGRKIVDMVVRDESLLFLKWVNKQFVKQGEIGGRRWDKLTSVTLELRRNMRKVGLQSGRGTKALIRSGNLRRSLTWQKVGEANYWVGVHRQSMKVSKAGVEPINVAAIHETGAVVIPVTTRMRKYFMWLFVQGVLKKPWPPKTKTHIVIRQRSYLASTLAEFRKGSEKRVAARWQAYLFWGKSPKFQAP